MTSKKKKPSGSNCDGELCLTCPCCLQWIKHLGVEDVLKMESDDERGTAKEFFKRVVDTIQENERLSAKNAELEKDNEVYKKSIKELLAKKNGIRAVPAKDRPKKGSRSRGRKKGCKPTINKNPEKTDDIREEILDGNECSDCKGDLSENCTDDGKRDRIMKIIYIITEMVRYRRPKRWCKTCKRMVVQSIPGARKYARRSDNHSALMTWLNMNGMSHGKAVEHSCNVIKLDISRTTAYRDKVSNAMQLEPSHDRIRQDVLSEEMVAGDEFHTIVPRDNDSGSDDTASKSDNKCKEKDNTKCIQNGYGLIALGENNCLVEITTNRRTHTLKNFLPDYHGLVRHDSYAAWMHIGKRHQPCMAHQIRLPKNEIKHENPKGDVLKFLEQIIHVYQCYYKAHNIEDLHTRRVAARCIDEQMRQIMNAEYNDDAKKTINKYKKRWKREGLYMSTFLYVPGLGPDNNDVERMNRTFKCTINDGGGNRSKLGMHVNSILFTILATAKLRKENFYDLLCGAAGDS